MLQNFNIIVILTWLLWSCVSTPHAVTSQEAQKQGLLMTYGGKSYALNDLPAKVRSDIYNAHAEYLNKIRPLLEQAALTIHREKTNDPRLSQLDQDITEAEIRAFYDANKAMLPYPLEDIKFELKTLAKNEVQEKRKAVILDELEKDGRLTFHVYHLHPPSIQIPLEGLASTGSSNAAITIVEFGDFTCPYCRKAYPVLKEFVEKHKDQVGFYFHPFSSHNDSFGAKQATSFAVMAECIHRLQPERYWDYQHMVFTGDSYGVPSASKVAAELKVPETELQTCLQDEGVRILVERQQNHAIELGVVKTPTLFINGELFTGEITLERLEQAISKY